MIVTWMLVWWAWLPAMWIREVGQLVPQISEP